VTAFDPKGNVSFVLTLEVEIPAINRAPNPDAGDDQVVDENELVFLDGSNSIDPDGDELAYEWRQVAGDPVLLTDAMAAIASFVAPTVDSDIRLVFTLTVRDAEQSAEATVAVDVVNLLDPSDLKTPECWFTVVPDGATDQPEHIEGQRPLTVTSTAVIVADEPVIGGTLAWAFDGVPVSGPVETHTVVNQVFTRGGVHTVALALTVAGGVTVSCHNGVTGSSEERFYVQPLISGYVRNESGVGIASVTVSGNLGATTAVTDAGGLFNVHVPYNWSGKLVVQHADYDFSPTEQNYVEVQGDVADQQFTGMPRVVNPPNPPNPVGCVSDANCDDGVFCNGAERCVTSACRTGDNPCPDQLCNEQTDTCYSQGCVTDADCNDGVFCNGAETCDPQSGCRTGAPVACDDGVSCTVDSCNEATNSCDYVPENALCDNGLFCDGRESCHPALGCQASTPVSCTDGVACTVDVCNEVTDTCRHTPDHSVCDNGLYCDGTESCHAVLGCQAGSNPCLSGEICDEGADSCRPGTPVVDRWIQVGDAWRYFKGRTAPPANWAGLDFDDASWAVGPTGMGYSTDVTYPTVLTDMLNTYVSFYARREFIVADPGSLSALQLALLYDDGFVAYINGTEVARSANMVGSVNYNTLAASSHDEEDPEQQFTINVTPGLLQVGANVLAIEVHNVDIGSSDACLVPRLAPDGAAPECVVDGDCNDGLFCTGTERCPSGHCVHSGNPCGTGETCNETSNACDPAPATTYEGFGAVTQGAVSSPMGYDVYHVTSLADSGAGTLRDAVSRGNRHVVFDVGGTITLAGDLNIPYSYITIDGASAPAPGITIVQPGTIGTTLEARSSIGAVHDVIIHHLRMDGQATAHLNVGDIWGLDGMAAPVYNVIIDHVTGIASTDGVFDIYGEVRDVTISWNLIMDTVTALHASTADLGQSRERVSVHHNVFARNNERQIRIRHNNQLFDYVNNVVSGWGWLESGGDGLHIVYDAGEINPSLNVENNVFRYVDGLGTTAGQAIVFERGPDEGSVYFSGNIVPSGEADAVSTSGRLPIPAYAQVTTYPAASLCDNVVPLVGTHYPTVEETQVLGDIRAALCGSAPECAIDADCNDAVFCNGRETCSAGACVSGSNPCAAGERCDELTDTCQPIDPGAWVPPIGIPEPSFGIRETAPPVPSPWDAQTPGFYYVDQYHPGATDSSNTYGTPARPRVSIPNTLPAGAVVEVHGLYTLAHSSPRMIGGDGSPQSPIFIRGTSSANRPRIAKAWEIKGHYMILENLEFADEDGDLSGGDVGRPIMLAPAHHVALRASEVSGNLNSGGVGLASWTGETAHDIVVYDNLIHHNGDWQATFDQDRHGVAVGTSLYNVWILDNEMHHNSGDGVQINGDATTHHIYVGRNLSWQNKQTGFWCKTAYDVVFSQNEAHSHVPSGSSPGAGMGWQYDGKRIWFLYNHLHDNTLGVRGASASQGGTEDIYLIGNVIHHTTDWAIQVWSTDPIVYVVHNTVSGSGGGIWAQGSEAFHMSNNIISSVGGLGQIMIIGSLAQRAYVDHCLLHQSGGTMRIEWEGAVFNSLAAFQAATGRGQGCVEGDPRFVNVGQNDFHLQSGSPAIGRGVAHTAYAAFAALYGLDIAVDRDGILRGEGQGYEIGAYEY
jgi:hypothetical protein